MNEHSRRGWEEVASGVPVYVPHYDEVFSGELVVNYGEICKGDQAVTGEHLC